MEATALLLVRGDGGGLATHAIIIIPRKIESHRRARGAGVVRVSGLQRDPEGGPSGPPCHLHHLRPRPSPWGCPPPKLHPLKGKEICIHLHCSASSVFVYYCGMMYSCNLFFMFDDLYGIWVYILPTASASKPPSRFYPITTGPGGCPRLLLPPQRRTPSGGVLRRLRTPQQGPRPPPPPNSWVFPHGPYRRIAVLRPPKYFFDLMLECCFLIFFLPHRVPSSCSYCATRNHLLSPKIMTCRSPGRDYNTQRPQKSEPGDECNGAEG